MPDLALSVLVHRDLLSLDPLQINDHVTYYLAPGSLGAQVTYSRQQAGSPWVDGAVTTNRNRQMVNEPVVVEVLAESSAELKFNIDTLVDAFSQDTFTLEVAVDGQNYGYLCDAADYQIAWTGSRLVARQGQVTFSMPRQPVALVGTV